MKAPAAAGPLVSGKQTSLMRARMSVNDPKQTLTAVRDPDVWLLIGAALVIEIDPDRRQCTFKRISA